ncbi:hypothetical protein Pint_11394 [Pistacia integerrima]|uniref:Uncharacterized protein n=1 Tax=Pistacia integerrima TaxID=434235 RepID=A0ACC0XJU6_9ROSI|nr:hypothetical protein Pint_11394 [Pistacia integerrima]
MEEHPVYGEMMSFGGSHHGQGQQDLPFKTTNESLQVMLLHGNLDVWVNEAKNLPNIDMVHKRLGKAFDKLNVKVSSKIKGHKSEETISGPYVTLSISGAVVGRTFVICKSQQPVWMQHFSVPVAHFGAEVHFVLKDSYVVASEIVGAVGIPLEQLCSGTKIEGEFPIINSNGQPCNEGAVLSLSIQYTPIQNLSLYRNGVVSGPDDNGVPGTYFPPRRGCKVTLYQDAHIQDGCLPNLKLDGGVEFNHASCWQDIYDAISEARHLIYIAGWSLDHTVRLVRDGSNNCNLGDLLKTKSQEGVRVLLLVWDDPTSFSLLGYKREGNMDTSDEETRRFFKHSSVQVVLCPRSVGKGHQWVRKQVGYNLGTGYNLSVI